MVGVAMGVVAMQWQCGDGRCCREAHEDEDQELEHSVILLCKLCVIYSITPLEGKKK